LENSLNIDTKKLANFENAWIWFRKKIKLLALNKKKEASTSLFLVIC